MSKEDSNQRTCMDAFVLPPFERAEHERANKSGTDGTPLGLAQAMTGWIHWSRSFTLFSNAITALARSSSVTLCI